MSDDDDTLGYGRPPVWSRFQPGESGNPKGRPRKKQADLGPALTEPSEHDDKLRAQLHEPVTITTRHGQQKVTRIEAIQMAQQKAALQGNTNAQRDVLRAARELEERDNQRKKEEAIERRASFDRIRGFRDARIRQWMEAEQRGIEPTDPWPHPDDIILDESNYSWKLRGPLDERDVPFYQYIRAERDWHFSMMILKARLGRSRAQRRLGMALHSFWLCYDVMLPKRWQIAGESLDELIALFFLFPIAELKKDAARFDIERRMFRPAGSDTKRDSQTYHLVNDAMKPLLRRYGYRSLAHFEKTYDALGPDMPWPKSLVKKSIAP